MQASRKVRPILEQAAAAAAAAANAEGTAKAQTAAKKAKKLTPEEMKKMRQQADPNYQAKQAAIAGDHAHADGTSKKAKKGKAVASKPKPTSDMTAKQAPASSGRDRLADADAKPEAAATHAATQAVAQAAADHGAASGSKRRHGLGFTERQPQPKRAKQERNPPSPDPAASNDTGSDQAASDPHQQAPSRPTGDQQTKTKPALHTPPATAQTAVASPGAQGRAQSAAAVTAQGLPVIFTDECTAFVRGLDNKVTEAELRELLAGCGEIKGVRLVKDKVTGWFKVSSHTQSLLAS